MNNFLKKCFVCETEVREGEYFINQEINLPVCTKCKGTDKENEAVKELTEGLADGFVCGCI